MADFTDTLTYSVTIDGTVFSDSISETISTVAEAFQYKVLCGTTSAADQLLWPTSTPSGPMDFDPDYMLVINRDQTQTLTVQLLGDHNYYFEIPPNGSMKFNWSGSGTYDIEATTTGTFAAFVNTEEIYGKFPENEGTVEIMAIST